MADANLLTCDGCGQPATPEHIARRLTRLEWATRFRPIHIQTLLLAGVSSRIDAEFLYEPASPLAGEAENILNAVQVSTEGKTREALLAEFQKMGLMLAHVVECPLEGDLQAAEIRPFLEKHLPAAAARIRRSLRPKRILLLSEELQSLAAQLHHSNLGCPILPATAGTFLRSPQPAEDDLLAFRAALGGASA
jgi:hypothetical protein